MELAGIDHVVLYARDLAATIDFYTRVLGMQHFIFGSGHHALLFGSHKINVHEASRPWEPHARPDPGSLDVCLLTDSPISDVLKHLVSVDVAIELGPTRQTGARGQMTSVYLRDPDDNLIEIATYNDAAVR